jgi:hypothetical protein
LWVPAGFRKRFCSMAVFLETVPHPHLISCLYSL